MLIIMATTALSLGLPSSQVWTALCWPAVVQTTQLELQMLNCEDDFFYRKKSVGATDKIEEKDGNSIC